ncbi:MAG: hypothetical protein U0325_19340 [Polyangiales bacterium]
MQVTARVEAARRSLTAFVRERPDAPSRLRIDANWHLGWTLFQAGRFAEAIAPLERSGASRRTTSARPRAVLSASRAPAMVTSPGPRPGGARSPRSGR